MMSAVVVPMMKGGVRDRCSSWDCFRGLHVIFLPLSSGFISRVYRPSFVRVEDKCLVDPMIETRLILNYLVLMYAKPVNALR